MRLPGLHSRRGQAGWIAGAAVVVLALFVWVAPYNIAARLPHLPGVSWLLHTYMQNAVRTWSLGTEAPDWYDEDDPALVRLGAGHFETGCAPCHGAPGRPPNPVTRGMRPAPPPLDEPAADYAPRELHWIVRNGFKYTGMPAWPSADREDEPWALVAFLRDYPALDAEDYAALAYGPSAPPDLNAARRITFGGLNDRLDELTDTCARCHGEDGLGREGTAPRLAGQSQAYMEETLDAYASGLRPSGIMEPVAATLSQAEIAQLAEHYAGLPAGPAAPADPDRDALITEGAALAKLGDAERPSCLSCHGEGGEVRRNPLFPRIAGQDERFLLVWLRLWRDRPFGGTPYAQVMHEAARWLTDAQTEALAAYFSTLDPESRSDPAE